MQRVLHDNFKPISCNLCCLFFSLNDVFYDNFSHRCLDACLPTVGCIHSITQHSSGCCRHTLQRTASYWVRVPFCRFDSISWLRVLTPGCPTFPSNELIRNQLGLFSPLLEDYSWKNNLNPLSTGQHRCLKNKTVFSFHFAVVEVWLGLGTKTTLFGFGKGPGLS